MVYQKNKNGIEGVIPMAMIIIVARQIQLCCSSYFAELYILSVRLEPDYHVIMSFSCSFIFMVN